MEPDKSRKTYPTTWIRGVQRTWLKLRHFLISTSKEHRIPSKQSIVRSCRHFHTPRIWRNQINIKAVEECPDGYPRLAAFLDSDENFMLYRRFGFLQSRLLLHKQDQLRELEKDLDRMDKYDQIENPSLLKSREKDDAVNGSREKLLCKVEDKFKEYGNLVSTLGNEIFLETNVFQLSSLPSQETLLVSIDLQLGTIQA